jgi:hypothetical protein
MTLVEGSLLLEVLCCSFNNGGRKEGMPKAGSPCKIAQDQNEVKDGL